METLVYAFFFFGVETLGHTYHYIETLEDVSHHENYQAYRGLNGGFLLLRIFIDAISVSPHVCLV